MRVPASTYRLQFTANFRFADARELLPYLSDLGITEVYASPVFTAREGSSHGYDILDHLEISPQLGGMEEFSKLIADLRERNMGWIQDFVPNHMAFDPANTRLMDVMENGQASPHIEFFDITWNHPYESIRGRVLAPFLGKPFGECLENGEITVGYDEQGFSVRYYHFRFPLRIESYSKILTQNLLSLRRKLDQDIPTLTKFYGILYILKTLSADDRADRTMQIAFVKRMLWELTTQSPDVRECIDVNVDQLNGTPGAPDSFNRLEEILAEQHYKLSFWKIATAEINYRRFFTVNDMIALKVEHPQVFNDIHRLLFGWLDDGTITGARIDHIDGLFDPLAYLLRFRERAPSAYLVVEKILDPEEDLHTRWPVQGTTGYDFLNYANGLFCERSNEHRFEKLYLKFSAIGMSFRNIMWDKKRLIIGRHMAGEVEQLAYSLKTLASNVRHARDLTLYGLRRALVEVLALFTVYRTYASETMFSEIDRLRIRNTIARARETLPIYDYELDFLGKVLLLEFDQRVSESDKRSWTHFVMRFQQFTGPLMAKSFEDTTMYVYNKLISLNEVGGSPNAFGISPVEFHHFCKKRQSAWPHAMNATSTHDTKRGEDARATIDVLSEIPDEWEKRIVSWHKMNAPFKKQVKGEESPDKNDEYFLYQTLVGGFPYSGIVTPEFSERTKNYIGKAIKEAKIHTGWSAPDEEYEKACQQFIDDILRESDDNAFLKDFTTFHRKISRFGIVNNLSQLVLKMTAPGVPDFYQGSEFWDLSYVDPDNRRPVDYRARRAALARLKRKEQQLGDARLVSELLRDLTDPRMKMFVMYKGLGVRRVEAILFANGEYIPLTATGERKDHLLSFVRRKKDRWSITVIPRLVSGLLAVDELPMGETFWKDTRVELPDEAPRKWKNIFTEKLLEGEKAIPVSEILRDFFVGWLVGGSPE